MVSSQVLLGVAIASLLLLIGGYALHLWHRLNQLEEARARPTDREPEPPDPP